MTTFPLTVTALHPQRWLRHVRCWFRRAETTSSTDDVSDGSSSDIETDPPLSKDGTRETDSPGGRTDPGERVGRGEYGDFEPVDHDSASERVVEPGPDQSLSEMARDRVREQLTDARRRVPDVDEDAVLALRVRTPRGEYTLFAGAPTRREAMLDYVDVQGRGRDEQDWILTDTTVTVANHR